MTLTRPPRLWNPHPHRRVTWLELFFDLIFVAAVAQVGAPLAGDYSLPGVFRYAFLFVLIWWAWSGHTLYTTRFDLDDPLQRLLLLVQCFIAAVMAANARDALDSRSSAGFGAAYAAMRIVLVVQYLRVRRVAGTRVLATRYAAGIATAAVLWMASAFLDAPERYWVWGLALAVDFATPWLAGHHTIQFPPDAAHFPERFGLFTIILLGEFVAAVMRGIESQEYWSFSAAATAFAGMAFAFAVWWWYFDAAQSAAERHIRSKRQAHLFQIWHYAHLPLFLGIGVTGVGFERLIGEGLAGRQERIFCVAVAMLMMALVMIGATSGSKRRRGFLRSLFTQTVLSVGISVVGIWAAGLSRVILAVGLVAGCGVAGLATYKQRESGMPHGLPDPLNGQLLNTSFTFVPPR